MSERYDFTRPPHHRLFDIVVPLKMDKTDSQIWQLQLQKRAVRRAIEEATNHPDSLVACNFGYPAFDLRLVPVSRHMPIWGAFGMDRKIRQVETIYTVAALFNEDEADFSDSLFQSTLKDLVKTNPEAVDHFNNVSAQDNKEVRNQSGIIASALFGLQVVALEAAKQYYDQFTADFVDDPFKDFKNKNTRPVKGPKKPRPAT